MTLLVEAIFEAEAEGLSAQAAEARAQLPQLAPGLVTLQSSFTLLQSNFGPKLFVYLRYYF